MTSLSVSPVDIVYSAEEKINKTSSRKPIIYTCNIYACTRLRCTPRQSPLFYNIYISGTRDIIGTRVYNVRTTTSPRLANCSRRERVRYFLGPLFIEARQCARARTVTRLLPGSTSLIIYTYTHCTRIVNTYIHIVTTRGGIMLAADDAAPRSIRTGFLARIYIVIVMRVFKSTNAHIITLRCNVRTRHVPLCVYIFGDL